MARGEFEAGQLVVMVPSFATAPLRNVSWEMNALQHTESPGVAIPAADVRVMPVGFVHEGPCAFDASSPSCPADKPVQCKLGDATNNTQRCVAHGGSSHGSVQCVGCSGSSGMTNTASFYSHADPRGWWPAPLLDTVTHFDVAVGTVQPLCEQACTAPRFPSSAPESSGGRRLSVALRTDVLVRTRPDTQPGTYTGELSVWPAGLPHNGRMVRVVVHGVTIPGDPSPGTWGVERRAEFSPLGPRAGCFLALGSGLGLVGTGSSRR